MSKLDDYLKSISSNNPTPTAETNSNKGTSSKLGDYLASISSGNEVTEEQPVEPNPYQSPETDSLVKNILDSKSAKPTESQQLEDLKTRNESLSMPKGSKQTTGSKISSFLSGIFGFGGRYEENSTADTIKMQEKARWENRKEEVDSAYEGVGREAQKGFASGLLGAQSTWQTAEALVAKKLGFDEFAKKKENEGIETRNLKKVYDAEYRSGKGIDSSLSEKLKSAPVKYLAGQIAESLPISLGSLAVGATAGTAGLTTFTATTLTVATMSLFSYGSAYQDAREFGLGEEEATNIAGKIAITTAPLEALPEFRLLNKITGSSIATDTLRRSYIKNLTRNLAEYSTSFAEQGLLEAGTEVPQTVIENAWKQTYDENQDLMEGVTEAGLVAFFSGGITDTLVSTSTDLFNNVKNLSKKDVSEKKATDMIQSGMSPEQVAYELSKDIGATDAMEVVATAQANVAEQIPTEDFTLPEYDTQTPTAPVESTSKPFTMDNSYLDKTPTDFQNEVTTQLESSNSSIKELSDKVDELQNTVDTAQARSQEKKVAKIALSKAKTELETAKAKVSESVDIEAGKIKDIVSTYAKENNLANEMTQEQMDSAIEQIVQYVNDPVTGELFADTPIKEIAKAVFSEIKPITTKKNSKTKAKDTSVIVEETNPDNAKTGESKTIQFRTTKGGNEVVTIYGNRPDSPNADENGRVWLEEIDLSKAEKKTQTTDKNLIAQRLTNPHENYNYQTEKYEEPSTNKPKTQKEIVQESVKEKAKSIKQIAKETGIVEPNIRRILGVGTKEGVFERIDNGVYVLSKDGVDMAFIEAGNSLDVLPRLISEGKKFDMIYSDLPYESGGNIGGNRPLGYVAITPEIYKTVVENYVKLLKDENTPIIHIMTTGKSSAKQAKQYNDAILNNPDLQLVAVGSYVKLRPNGEVSNMGKYPMPPEAVMIFNQSGILPENLPASFEVRALDPKFTKNNYKTQKAVELVDALIDYTTKTGGNILDPFAGSGLMTAEAVKKGRKSTAIEIDPNVVENVIKPRVKKAVEESQTQEEPLIDTTKPFYHGTLADFENFSMDRVGENTSWDNAKFGVFFSDSKERATQFVEDTRPAGDSRPVNVKEVMLDIKNPIDLTLQGIFNNEKQAPTIIRILGTESGVEITDPKEALEYLNDNIDLGDLGDLQDALYGDIENKKIMQDAGYDGIVSQFGKDDNGDVIKEYVAFDISQIKTDNISNGKDNNNSGGNNNESGLSDSLGLGTEEQGGAGSKTESRSKTKRGSKGTIDNAGNGLTGATINGVTLEKGKKYTNIEIESLITGVTTITDGEVSISDESLITEELKEALNQYEVGGTTKEGRGILDEYFTSSKIVDAVSQILNIQKDVKVLEPSVGSGNFVYAIPEAYRGNVNGYEINPMTAGIAKVFHTDMTVRTDPFESLFVDERGNKKTVKADYDIVIGNPPYGAHRGLYLGLGEETKIDKYETYFIKRGLDLLKDGGRLAMVVPSGFMRSGMKAGGKVEIAKMAHIVEAWRLPNGSFDNTDVGTDIVVFEKGAGKFPASNIEFISNDYYFATNPDNILGTQVQKQGKFGMEAYVNGTLDEALDMFTTRRTEMLAKNLLEENNIEVTEESLAEAENAVIDDTGKVDPKVTAEKIKEDTKTKKVIAKIKKEVTKETSGKKVETISIAEQLSDISPEEMAIWERTNRDGYVPYPTEEEKKTLNYYNGSYYNDFNYAQGDIYEKLDTLESDKKSYPQYADYEKQKAKLLAVLPKPETISSIKLPPNHAFTDKVKLSSGDSLKSDFKRWLGELPHDVFGDASRWEVTGYVNNEQVRGSDKLMNESVRVRRKIKAEELFKKYLNELEESEQKIITSEYNKQYNSYHKPDFTKVPQFQKINKTFKNGKFSLRASQKESLGMIANRGSAIVALDVGNGKTLVGVLATTEAMHRGYSKRPLWVVPNPSIAKQWIDTAKDISPNVKINNLGNLGASFGTNLDTLEIKEGEITIITKEGLQALGFSDETYADLSSKFGYVADDLKAHKTKRDVEKGKASADTIKGKMKRGTRSDLSFEKLGFDYFVYDEVHQANHIVSKVKMAEGKATDFRTGQPSSNIGIKTWLASQYIQSKNDGKNVVLLSATPFTNNPLEYYSILSLIGDKYLAKIGASNVNDFFNMFMEASSDYEVKANGSIDRKNDIRGFKNHRQWKNLLNQFSVFANQPKDIIVPDKHNESYYIPQNEMQMNFNSLAQDLFNEKEAGALLGVGEMKKIAFSPFLSRYYDGVLQKSDYKMFVEGSPKIKVTMELIRQNLKDRPEAGQIIYTADTGKDTSPLMQEYLIKELKLKPEQVGIINGDTPQAKRMTMQEEYNTGKIKVIIGSDAIQVGMELQINSTDLYILGMPWNFTSLRQVTGRIHRQNNKWKNVRINVMMSENSADVFQMQKIQNKQDRYEASLKEDAQEVDLGDINSEEMKADLMTDPVKKAKFIIQQRLEILGNKVQTAKAEQAFALRKFEKLQKAQKDVESVQESLNYEKKQYAEKQSKGLPAESMDTYWIDSYTKKLIEKENNLQQIRAEFEEKGISLDRLDEINKRTNEEVAGYEAEIQATKDGEKALTDKIASEMPPMKTFTPSDINAFVASRAEQNKTFYELRQTPKDIDVTVETKEIKNTTGTKVLKEKKAVTRKPAVKQTKSNNKIDPISLILADKKLTVKEKVTKLLDKKQESKDFKDTGERVAGSKKENAVIRAVMENGDSEILNALIEELGIEAVSALYDKEEILKDTPKPDVEADKTAKVPAYIAGAKQNIFRLINKKPSLESKKRGYYSSSSSYGYFDNGMTGSYTTFSKASNIGATKLYPELMKAFVSDLANVETYEHLSNLRNKSYYFTPEGEQITSIEIQEKQFYKFSTDIFGKTVDSAFKDAIETDSKVNRAKYHIKEAQEWTSKDNNDNGYNYRIQGLVDGAEYVYRTYNSFTTSYDTKEEADKYLTPENRALIVKAIQKEIDKYNTDYTAFLPKKAVKNDSINLEHGNFATIETYDVDNKRVPDKRVNTETLMKNLGFKSVQLGNYVEDESAKEHIRQTIGAMEDMSSMLGVDFAKINNKKGLSIAFGARGGGRFLAHYEPVNNIINLTKKRGDGSFGHEYAHFLDWVMGGSMGKLSGQYRSNMRRYYTSMKPYMELMQAIMTGRGVKSEQTFKPENNFNVEQYWNNKLIGFRENGNSLEEAIKQFGDSREKLQSVANVYRETVTAKVGIDTKEFGWSSEFYANSKKFGGGSDNSYWVQNHELFARAFQAYLEDKMIEKGISNNYVTRPTKDIAVYPQGVERETFNAMFDTAFREMAREYPYQASQEPRFRIKQELKQEKNKPLVLTKGGDYLADVKARLNLDFDVYFTDMLLYKNQEAWGAMYDNSIILATFDEMTKAHETMHLLLSGAKNIPIFQRAGINKEIILTLKAKEMGLTLTGENAVQIEEQLAYDFEKYLANKYKPKGLIARFFEILRIQFAKIKKAIGLTDGNLITDFYDIIDEGVAKENELVKLENNGVIASFLDDSGITDMSKVVDFTPRFKFKDGRLENMSQKLGEIESKYTEYEDKLALWKQSLSDEIGFQISAKEIIDGTAKEIKDISKYTYRTSSKKHTVGQFTAKGLELARNITDPQLQAEVTAYLKARIELKDARKKAQAIRKDMRVFKGEKKMTGSAQKTITRQIRKRKNQVKFIEQGIDYSARRVVPKVIKDATKYGKKAKLQEIRNRQAEIVIKMRGLPLSIRGKVAVLNTVRNSTTKAQYDNAMKKLDFRISEYQKAKAISKDLSSQRSQIGYIKHIGEMDYALMSDVKEQLGINKSLREMNKQELSMIINELQTRLEFKQSKGFGIENAQLTESEVNAIVEKRMSEQLTKKQKLKEWWGKYEISTHIDEILGASATRLFSINQKLSRVVRNWYVKTQKITMNDSLNVKEFVEGVHKLKSKDKASFEKLSVLLNNRDVENASTLLATVGLDMTSTRKTLDEIYNRAKEVGVDLGYLENYFPRKIKDSKRKEFIALQIKLAQKEMGLGRELTREEEIQIENNALLGYDYTKFILSKTGNMKERNIDVINQDFVDFYEGIDIALAQYVVSMNANIEARRFFGRFAKDVDIQGDLTDTIGAYVLDLVKNEEIQGSDVNEVTSIIKALFSKNSMNRAWQTATNLSYIFVMGTSIGSTITQITELGYGLAKNGFWGTWKGMQALTSKDRITTEDLYLELRDVLETGTTTNSGKFLKYNFLLQGLTLIDKKNLEVFINGRYAHYQSYAMKEELPSGFKRKLNEVFGENTGKVLNDLKNGKISEEVKRLIIDDVLDFRPQGVTEKSQFYNEAGWAKIFYTLKQFTLKQFDIYRKQVYLEIRNGMRDGDMGQVKNGVRMFVAMSAYLVLLGIGADELRDWIFGKDSTLSAKLLNNIFKLFGLNQYLIDVASQGDITRFGTLLLTPTQVTAPADFLSRVLKDITNPDISVDQSESIRYIPIIGSFLYNRYGKGAGKNAKNNLKTEKDLILQDSVENDLGEDSYIDAVKESQMKNLDKELSPQAEGRLRRTYRIAEEYGADDEYANALEGSQNNDDKVEILHKIESELGDSFGAWIDNANYIGLVSDALYDKFYQID